MEGWIVRDEHGPILFHLSPWSREERSDCIPGVARIRQLIYTGARKGMPSGTTTGIRYSFSMGVEAWPVNTLTDEWRRLVEGIGE